MGFHSDQDSKSTGQKSLDWRLWPNLHIPFCLWPSRGSEAKAPNSVSGSQRLFKTYILRNGRVRVAVEIESRFNLIPGENSMVTRHRHRNPHSCEVVFRRGEHDIETLYWAGSMEEARQLARKIAFRG